MTDSDTIAAPIADLAKGVWWWVLIRGILAIVFGVIALFNPGSAILAFAIVFGAYALVDGIFSAVHAVRVRKELKAWGWLLAQGILSAIAGLIALTIPGLVGVFGGLVLLWTIVIWNVMHGIAGIRSAAGAPSGGAKTVGIIAGVLTILFGILLAVLVLITPGAALLGLVWLIGIYAIVFGVMLVVAAIQARVSARKTGSTGTAQPKAA